MTEYKCPNCKLRSGLMVEALLSCYIEPNGEPYCPEFEPYIDGDSNVVCDCGWEGKLKECRQ